MRRVLVDAVSACRLLLAGSAGAFILGAAFNPVISAELPDQRLLHKDDLLHVGAFRVPEGGSGGDTFEYGGYSPAFNRASNSLFVVGHRQHQKTAEIAIPEIVASDNLSDLAVAEFLQPFADATQGRRRQINPGNKQAQVIGGQFVEDGTLLVNVYSTYDARGSQQSSLFIRSTDLQATDSISGPLRVGPDAHLTSAYIAQIPAAWQPHLGGSLLTGNCCRSIVGFQSHGPAVSAFDWDREAKRNSIAAINLLRYDSNSPLGPGMKSRNPVFNMTSEVEGVVFPEGSGSVLFFGPHGTGEYCYGEAEECGDKAMIYKGNHAYPYVYQVWAYDAADLVSVRRKRKNPRSVTPYDIWTFNLPFEADNAHTIGGVAYDSETDRLYLSQLRSDGNTRPVIHVFQVREEASPSPQ